MEILYCDKCGFRIPEALFTSGEAVKLDNKAYCGKCKDAATAAAEAAASAQGVSTAAQTALMPMVKPTDRPSAGRSSDRLAATKRQTQSISKIQTSILPKAQTARSTVQEISSSRNQLQNQNQNQRAPTNILLPVGVAGVACLLGLIFALSGNSKPPQSRSAEVTPSHADKPFVNERPAPRPPPAVSSNPPSSNTSSKDREAQNAFSTLLRFEGLKSDDYAGRSKSVEDFLSKYSESDLAPRARVLLYDLQKLAAAGEETAQRPPPRKELPPPDAPLPELKIEPVIAKPAVATAPDSLPQPPDITAPADALWKLDLTAAGVSEKVSRGAVARNKHGTMLKSARCKDNEDSGAAAEYDPGGGSLLFTVGEQTTLTITVYPTASGPFHVQFWARDGDKFANVGAFISDVKPNQWNTISKKMVGTFKTGGGRTDAIRSGLGVRNIQFYSGAAKSSADFYVHTVFVADGPADVASTAKPATDAAPNDRYAAFQAEFLELLRKRDAAGAAARLKKAEEDSSVKPLLSNDRRALAWLADIDAAVAKGAEKLKDTENFDLRQTKGQPIKIGKNAPAQVTGVQDGAIQVNINSINVPIMLDALHRETRDKLALLSLGFDAAGLARRCFLSVLALGANEEQTVTSTRLMIAKSKTSGMPAAECDYLEQLVSSIEKDVPELLAASAWDDLVRLSESKQPKLLKPAAASYATKHGKTQFGTKKADELKAMLAQSETGSNAVAPAAAPVTEGLAAHLKFDEGGGKAANDACSKSAAKLLNGATWGTGIVGGAASFDGGPGVIDFQGGAVGANALSVSCWVRHNAMNTKNERYVTFGDEAAVLRHEGLMGAGQLDFWLKTGEGPNKHIRAKGVLAAGQWTHICGTWDGTTQKLYKDGVLLDSQTPGGSLKDSSNMKIGSYIVEGMSGLIDDVRLYNRALTQEEISALATPPAKK